MLSSYSKQHLFPLLKEPQYLQPGEAGSVTGTASGKRASLICFDIRFPESARELAYDDARVLWRYSRRMARRCALSTGARC